MNTQIIAIANQKGGDDDIIICDPEAEYAPLVERLHGQVIKISPTSTNYINPMDLNLDYCRAGRTGSRAAALRRANYPVL